MRNVIEKEDAKNLLADVEKYMNENGQDPQTKGWKKNVRIFSFFNTLGSFRKLKAKIQNLG